MFFSLKRRKWIVRTYKSLRANLVKTWQRTVSPSLRFNRPYLPWLWRLFTKKHKGSTTFTVVTPVYNTGRYLDTYFKSLTRQTLDFKSHIHIIMVDDGSTDNSAAIIKKWQKRYPQNIEYIHQENQGINRARNQGLIRALAPWITWIDSDDFIHPNYFYEVDKALNKHKASKLVMLASRQITYYAASGEFQDNRPFKLFFEKGETLRPHNDLKDMLHYTVNSAFFSMDEIHRQNIRFTLDSDWRCFDDAHFVIRYLEGTLSGQVLFCRYPRYYYRKRGDSTSNVDVSLTRRQSYIEVLEEGYLDILKHFAQKYDLVPKWVQNSILYDMSWKIKHAVDSPQKISFLTPEERNQFLKLAKEVFSYIDKETVHSFPHKLSGFWHYYQIGSCSALKGEEAQSPYAYIETFDRIRALIKFRTYSSSPQDTMTVLFDDVPVKPLFSKTIHQKFLDRTFIYEHYQWIPFNEYLEVKMVTCARDDAPLVLDLGGRKASSYSAGQLAVHFARIAAKIRKPSSAAPWLLVDRDVLADDNAEHLYRHIVTSHPEQPICFAVRKSSPCWARLQKDGFHLVDFGSRNYEEMLKQTPKLISSHMDHHIVQFKPDIMQGKQYICLQHGVTKDDLSSWLNGKTIDLFITATKQEYDSIVQDGSPYKMGEKEVALTGFPRHDALLRLAGSPAANTKQLLIMPTWRNYLAGTQKGNGKTHLRELLPDFLDSHYAKAWLGLLGSERLTSLAERYGYKIVFFPHFGMQGYFKNFNIKPAIEILTHRQTGIQRLFADSTLMVTDYSSVAFEMAFLQKAVLYYQFDEKEFFCGDHVYTKGYFDYRRDGFGPVCTQEDDLLNELDILMECGGQPQDIYLKRMEKTFLFRDGQNCERVYQAIKALDIPV